jgi:hypothetical protein
MGGAFEGDDRMNRGHQWILNLKTELRRKVTDLIAMSRPRDPFFAGSPRDQKRARWFADMWERLEYKDKPDIHLRRLHYHLDAIGFRKLNGKPYKRTEDWEELNDCSRMARLLGMVPADAIVDHRNPDPDLADWIERPVTEPPRTFWIGETGWNLPAVRLDLPFWDMKIEAPTVTGYG